MASYSINVKQDLAGTMERHILKTPLVRNNQYAHVFNVEVTNAGVPYPVGSVEANFVQSNGVTVPLDSTYCSSSGNVATVRLPQACYTVPGRAILVINCEADGGITCIAWFDCTVLNGSTENALDPGTIIPSVETLIDRIDEAVESIPADYSQLLASISDDFSTETPFAAGAYVWGPSNATHPGALYRFTSAHSGSWVETDATIVVIGNELNDTVRYTPQVHTDAEKAVARTNMGAAAAADLTALSNSVGTVPSGTTVENQIFSQGTQISTNASNIDALQRQVGTVPTGETVEGQITDLKSAIDGAYASTLAFTKYALHIDIVTLATTRPKRGHSELFRAKENITVTVNGIPEGYILLRYVVDSLTQSISNASIKVENGVPFTITAGQYYRYVIHDNDLSDAYEIDSIVYLEQNAQINKNATTIHAVIENRSKLIVTDNVLMSAVGVVVKKINDNSFSIYGTASTATHFAIFNGQNTQFARSEAVGKTIDKGLYTLVASFDGYGTDVVFQARTANATSGSVTITSGTSFTRTADSSLFVRIQTDKDYGTEDNPTIVTFVLNEGESTNDNPLTAVDIVARERIDRIKSVGVYDLILFAGQSNMAGRGITSEEHPETYPTVIEGAGYEFRAISDPTTLYPIAEPFGYAENKSGGLNDRTNKTGGCTAAFVNAYYKNGSVPIIAVSASEGATDLQEWLQGYGENTGRLYDACSRFQDAVAYCAINDIPIRHKYVVWMQGETDAVNIYNQEYTIADYAEYFESVQEAFLAAGAEKVLVIRIGKRGGTDGSDTGSTMYDNVIEKQTELCKKDTDLVMICAVVAGMRARGYMKDQSHYYQVAYNEFGTYAGVNAALYANTGKEPTMYDPEYDNLYYCKKN